MPHPDTSVDVKIKNDVERLETLPPEMLVEILSSCSLRDIIHVTQTSKELNNKLIVNANNNSVVASFWQAKLKSYFPEKAKKVNQDYAKVFIDEYKAIIQQINEFGQPYAHKYLLLSGNDHEALIQGFARLLSNPTINKNAEFTHIAAELVKFNISLCRFLQRADASFKSNKVIVLEALKQEWFKKEERARLNLPMKVSKKIESLCWQRFSKMSSRLNMRM